MFNLGYLLAIVVPGAALVYVVWRIWSEVLSKLNLF